MNTKQKLTLGIAAIFMVTLTIVGVTYAYFVTRVTGDTSESVNVQTATVGALEFQNCTDGNEYAATSTATAKLTNVMPGASVSKAFAVKNADKVNGQDFTVQLTTGVPENKNEFMHTDDTTGCYGDLPLSNEPGTVATCFVDGKAYNYIKVELFKADGKCSTTAASDASDPIATLKPTYSATLGASYQDLTTTKEHIAAATDDSTPTYNNYFIKVTYEEAKEAGVAKNQNIENLAGLDLKVDIKY